MLMAEWHFYCEKSDPIPLPPAYSFPQAFNYLNEKGNSFHILESLNGDYIQCGGGRERCTVEIRRYSDQTRKSYKYVVVGIAPISPENTPIEMSHAPVTVRSSEVLDRWQAIQLFDAFFHGRELPSWAQLREMDISSGAVTSA
jgi:hypothetical protein